MCWSPPANLSFWNSEAAQKNGSEPPIGNFPWHKGRQWYTGWPGICWQMWKAAQKVKIHHQKSLNVSQKLGNAVGLFGEWYRRGIYSSSKELKKTLSMKEPNFEWERTSGNQKLGQVSCGLSPFPFRQHMASQTLMETQQDEFLFTFFDFLNKVMGWEIPYSWV